MASLALARESGHEHPRATSASSRSVLTVRVRRRIHMGANLWWATMTPWSRASPSSSHTCEPGWDPLSIEAPQRGHSFQSGSIAFWQDTHVRGGSTVTDGSGLGSLD